MSRINSTRISCISMNENYIITKPKSFVVEFFLYLSKGSSLIGSLIVYLCLISSIVSFVLATINFHYTSISSFDYAEDVFTVFIQLSCLTQMHFRFATYHRYWHSQPHLTPNEQAKILSSIQKYLKPRFIMLNFLALQMFTSGIVIDGPYLFSENSVYIKIFRLTSHATLNLLLSIYPALYIEESSCYRAQFDIICEKLESFANNQGINEENILTIRSKFQKICDMLTFSDNFFSYVIFSFYTAHSALFFIKVYFIIFNREMSHSRYTFLSICFYILVDFQRLALVTESLVGVYTAAQNIKGKVYQLTLRSREIGFLNQVNLFLYKIGQGDVGFTFAKLFVICPNFITSLFTAASTIIIGIPSLYGFPKN